MKNLARCLICFVLINITNVSFANEWMPYQPQQTIQYQPVVVQPQPVIVYQWVPYTVPQTYVVQHQCFFKIKQTIITVPIIQWVLQPVIANYR